uniref:Putative polyprotein n=1 Tax=Varroa destructor virus 3/5 TaxID=2873539 RepID=A0A8K1QZ49_9VIRU|nr:MAG: putative polyprotein [Varroa destructor virus 3/5]
MDFANRKATYRNGGRSMPVPPINCAWGRWSTLLTVVLVAATVIYMNCIELQYTFNLREMRFDHIICTLIWIMALIFLVVNGVFELEYRIKNIMYNMFLLDAPKTTTYEDTAMLESMKVNPLVTAHPDTFPSCQLMVLTCNDQGVWCRAGNGFRISKTIVVPTHVIDTSAFTAKYVRLAVPEGKRLGKMVVVETPIKDILTIGDDISLINISEIELNRLGVTAARIKTLDTKQTSVMAMIYSYAPLFKASVGKISPFDGLAQQIEFSGSTIQGFSGAPYVAGKNDVYGMHTSGGAVNFGISASYLQLLVLGTESNDTIIKSQDNPLSRLIKRFMELENGSSVMPESRGGYSSDRTLEEFLSDWDNKKKGKIGRNWNDSLGAYVYSIEGRFYNITEDIDNYAQTRFPHLFEDADFEYDIHDEDGDKRVRHNKFSKSKRYANPIEDEIPVEDIYEEEEEYRLEERRRKKVEFDEFVRKHELAGSAWWADESATKRVKQSENVGIGVLFNSLTKLTALVEDLKQKCLAAEVKSDQCHKEHQQLMKRLLIQEANANPNGGYKDDVLMEPIFHGDSEAELLADYNQMVAPMLVEDELDLLRETVNKSEVSYEEVRSIRSICNRLTQLGKFSNQLLSTIDKIRADKKKREAEERARQIEMELKVKKEEELKKRAIEMEESRARQESEAKEKEVKRGAMCLRVRELFESLTEEEIKEFSRLVVERNTERALIRKAEKEKMRQEVISAIDRPEEKSDKKIVLEGTKLRDTKSSVKEDIRPPPKGMIRCPSCIIRKAKDRPCFSNKSDFFKHMEEVHLTRLEAAPSGN